MRTGMSRMRCKMFRMRCGISSQDEARDFQHGVRNIEKFTMGCEMSRMSREHSTHVVYIMWSPWFKWWYIGQLASLRSGVRMPESRLLTIIASA